MALSVEWVGFISGGNHTVAGRDCRLGGQGCKLHRRACTVAVGIIQQGTCGCIVEDVIIGITGSAGCTGVKIGTGKGSQRGQGGKYFFIQLNDILPRNKVAEAVFIGRCAQDGVEHKDVVAHAAV